MILPIYIYGQPVLRKVAEDITPDYPDLKVLINNMYETLDSSNGIGLAVTDPLQIIANGLATVSTHELFTYIETYIQKEQVERIVIGKPMQPNGQPSENLARVENFYNRWRKAHPESPIGYYDE